MIHALMVFVLARLAARAQILTVSNPDASSPVSCNITAEECSIIVEGSASSDDNEYHCPNSPACTKCVLECNADNACLRSKFFSYECDTVVVSSTTGDAAMQVLDIIAPVNGSLSVIVNSSSTDVFELGTIEAPMTENVYIYIADTVTGDAATNFEVNGSDITGILDIRCGGECLGATITCPTNSVVNGPSCFIDCSGPGHSSSAECKFIKIYSVYGTPRDVKLDCGSEEGECTSTSINCYLDTPCSMMYDEDSSTWSCSGACNIPTTAPSSIPTSEPSNIPSTEPTLNPSSIPSTMPTNHPSMPTVEPTQPSTNPSNYPSIMPSNNPSLMPSMPSSEPSLGTTMPVVETASTSSMPVDDPDSGGSGATNSGSSKNDSDAEWIAIIVCLAVLLPALFFSCLFYHKRKKSRDDEAARAQNAAPLAHTGMPMVTPGGEHRRSTLQQSNAPEGAASNGVTGQQIELGLVHSNSVQGNTAFKQGDVNHVMGLADEAGASGNAIGATDALNEGVPRNTNGLDLAVDVGESDADQSTPKAKESKQVSYKM